MPDGDQFWKHWGATEALEQGAADRHASLLLGRIVVIALLHCDCSAGMTGIVHVFLWGPDPFPSASAVTCHATYIKKKAAIEVSLYLHSAQVRNFIFFPVQVDLHLQKPVQLHYCPLLLFTHC